MSMTKYLKIYNHIMHEYIEKKKIGEKIPNETEFAEKLKASRMTVNKSINSLVDEGYLKRKRGKGTFIISKTGNNSKDLGELLSYSEDMKKRNITPTTKLISYEFIEHPDEDLVNNMNLADDESIHKIIRVRYAKDKAISLDYTFLSNRYIKEIDYAKLTSSLFQYYEEDLGIVIKYSDQEIFAVNADEKVSELLHVPNGSPLLKITGLTADKFDKIFEYTEVFYVSDAYRLKKRAYRPHQEDKDELEKK